MDDDVPAPVEASEAAKDFLIRQSVVGELEEFFPPEFLDKVKDRFEARLAERARTPGAPDPAPPADLE